MTQNQIQALINLILPNAEYSADELRVLLTNLLDFSANTSSGSLQASYDIGNTINTYELLIDETNRRVAITINSTISGSYVNALGDVAAHQNSGDHVTALGYSAAYQNSGLFVNALGESTANQNSGNNVNALGQNAAYLNSGNNVNALSQNAAYQNSGNNVNALSDNAANQNSGNNVNALGSLAAYQNTGSNVNAFGTEAAALNALSNMTIIGADFISTYADHAAALAAINTGAGATPGHYLYLNASTNSVGFVTIT